MSRVPLLDRSTASAEAATQLAAIHQAFGATPNMFKAVASSPAALKMMAAAFAALDGGTLPKALGEKIAVAVADRNQCSYCLAAHTALGRKAGASADELRQAQQGEAADPATQAALQAALHLVQRRGQLDEATLQSLRRAGFTDGQVVELIAHVALNLFTNYVNVALAVPVDFPAVPLRHAAA